MKTLFISTSSPYPTTGGGAQRTALLLRGLQEVGETHLFFLQRDESIAEDVIDNLKKEYNLIDIAPVPRHGERGLFRYIRPLAPLLVDRLVHNFADIRKELLPDKNIRHRVEKLIAREKYDLLVCRLEGSALLVGAWDLAPTIVDIDNYSLQVYSQRVEQSSAKPVQKWILKRHYENLSASIPVLLRKCSHLWVSNRADIGLIDHPSVSVLSNIAFSSDSKADAAREFSRPDNDNTVLIVGSLDYQVNIEGIKCFLKEVWPLIRNKCPEAEFRIVGRGASTQLKSEWSRVEGVRFIGYVDDLDEEYRNSSFTVAPVFAGGGTKIKVLESLMHSRTCVVAEHSVRGYDNVLKHNDSVLVAESFEDMADQCIQLIHSAKTRDRLALCGHNLVKEHYSFDGFADEIRRSVSLLQG